MGEAKQAVLVKGKHLFVWLVGWLFACFVLLVGWLVVCLVVCDSKFLEKQNN